MLYVSYLSTASKQTTKVDTIYMKLSNITIIETKRIKPR